MRLTNFEHKIIKEAFLEVFKEGDIYLFGSRVDDTKRGGDIDLYIIPKSKLSIKEIFEKRSRLRVDIQEKIGEQQIDIVVSIDKSRGIEQEALRGGILL
jgi:predicted nucleotidyltransferase